MTYTPPTATASSAVPPPQAQQSAANPFGTAASSGNFTLPSAAGGTTAVSMPEVPPGASESAYQYAGQVASLPVTVGPEIAAILGSSPTSGDAFIKAVLDLPTYEQAQVEQILWGAGLYTSPTGDLIAQPVFGSYDAGNFAALANAVIAAHDRGTSISDVVVKNTGSGVLQALEEKAAGPVLGGGQTYQVTTSDPRTVYAATSSVYQKLLGRLPTSAEYQDALQSTQSAETQYQSAANFQTEQMSRAKYQQQIESRTAKLQPVV